MISKTRKGFSADTIAWQRKAMQYYRQIEKECIHQLSLDCVIFGFHENELKVLLLRWKGTKAWSLPGGFIRKNESVENAAERCLYERTGLKKTYLKNFGIFGDVHRFDFFRTWHKVNLHPTKGDWQRTISLGYFTLMEFSKVTPHPDFLTDECRWFNIDEIPSLLFDHNQIIDSALQAARKEFPYLPVKNLLPAMFTLPELQKLYETILGRSLDTRNFQRKIIASGILLRTEKRRVGTPYRSPFLYRIVDSRYTKAIADGSLMFS